MPLLKKLIIKTWFQSFLGAFLILFLLMTVGKLVGGFLRSSVTPQEVLFDYLLDIPNWFGRIVPLSCLVSTLFSLNRLVRQSELIAIFAGGFSRRKFLITLFQCSAVVFVLQFIVSSFVDPYTKKLRYELSPDAVAKFRHNKNAGLKSSSIASGRVWYRSEDYFFSYIAYDKQNKTLKDVQLHYYNNGFKGDHSVYAESAVYLDGEQWKFKNGKIISQMNGQNYPSLEGFQEVVLNLKEKEEDFGLIDEDIKTLNIFLLFSFIQKLKNAKISTSEYLLLFYDKISTSLICIVFTLIPLGAVYRPNRRSHSFGQNVVFTLIFSILYWLIHSSLLALGNSQKIPPFIASFLIPMISMAYIAYNIYRNRQLA